MSKQTKVTWVFWINLSIRKNWFKFFWKTRGANYLEVQLWIFKLSIGLPWHKEVVKAQIRDYGHTRSLELSNLSNSVSPYSFWLK